MEENDNSVLCLNNGVRKKKSQPRRQETARHTKYADTDPLALNYKIPCRQGRNSKFCCCSDIVKNRLLIYKNESKEQQDLFLTRFISAYAPDRHRISRINMKLKPRKFSATYFLKCKKKIVVVCKKLFMAVTSMKTKRLNTIGQKILRGELPKERRGGDRKTAKYAQKKASVTQFIQKLPASESHYNRAKSKRIYLRCDWNLTKLLKVYNDSVESEDLKVKYKFFRTIFVTDFNIGFKTPATDVCNTCSLLDNKLKNEKDPQEKTKLITEKRIHRLRAKEFSKLCQEEPENSISLCFDLQKVHPLPCTNIQDAYYCRQISYHTFGVVDMSAKSPTFYAWTEDQASRGSNEIGSALLCHLDSLDIPSNVNTIRLFCDGCGGQNKNSHILHALMYWLIKKSLNNLETIQITFPVRGHSYLPADRVFGRVESNLKQFPNIYLKEEYVKHYSQFGIVKIIGRDWYVYDLKGLEKKFKKIDHIQDLKRVIIKKHIVKGRLQCLVKGLENFRFESEMEKFKNLIKRGQSYNNLRLDTIRLGRVLNGNKKKDVLNLLKKLFGQEWAQYENLSWYKNILLNDDIEQDPRLMEEDVNCCDCVEFDFGRHI